MASVVTTAVVRAAVVVVDDDTREAVTPLPIPEKATVVRAAEVVQADDGKRKAATPLLILEKAIVVRAAEVVATTTSTSYKEATFPIYQLWISVSKKALQGQDLAEDVDAKTFFDPTLGKTLVPFEKVQKFKTPAHLFRAFSMFKEAVTVLYNLAPRAWSGFETQVYRTEASCGFALTQQYVGEVLRRLRWCGLGTAIGPSSVRTAGFKVEPLANHQFWPIRFIRFIWSDQAQ